MLMSFRCERVLRKIVDKEFIDVTTILDVFQDDEYLPKNSADAYRTLKLLTRQKYLKKVQRGLYKVQTEFIKQELGALK